MKIRVRSVFILALALVLLLAAGAAAFVYAGIYNIAATQQHTQPVYRLLQYAMRRSVKARTDSIAVPDLNDKERVLRGAHHYQAHCIQCHGAPGVAPDALAYGMTPEPANLVSTAREWKPAQIYWVVRHGIKMSGMPAWESRMSDDEMWDIVAFVEAMATLSPVEYAELDREASRHPHSHGRPDTPSSSSSSSSSSVSRPPPAPASDPDISPPTPALAGDVTAGRKAIGQYLCATCHEIPGVVGANYHVGPPLKGIAKRRYIAGVLLNNPENMVRWLRDPKQVDPLSAMPDLGLTEQDARDIAAYLYTLEDVE